MAEAPVIRAPRGTSIVCKGWQQEAAFRMIQHNLDPEVAERPEELIVYGGAGKAARDWPSFHRILETLRALEGDETLLVQSGKPVGVFRTHEDAPRVLIANALLVPAWATWDEFRRLDAMGLTMFGQMTAGSWIYIGTQGILQGTYETFVAAGDKHFGAGDLAGRAILSGGLGGMGGAQPLAATMAGGVFLGIEVDPDRIRRRLEHRYLDRVADDLDEALALVEEARQARRPLSVGLCANTGDAYPEIARRGFSFDLVTDQTSAHDLLNGYVPHGLPLPEALALRKSDPDEYRRRAGETACVHVRAMLDLQRQGAHVFDYGNNIRQVALDRGVEDAFDFPGFVPAYVRPLFCEGKGPFRWVALSGDPADITATDAALKEAFAHDRALVRWLDMAAERVHFQGLPSRICWLGQGDRAKAGAIFNDLVRSGKVTAPIVIGRDHLDTGSVASPNRETEGMKDGSDAIADWPVLNALLNAVSGATWVSVHHGGGVGIGYALHAGMVIVADGTDGAARRLERVLTCDPGIGLIRHADAGYEQAIDNVRRHGLKAPSLPSE